LQAQLTQVRYDSEFEKATDQLVLALTQRLAGDTTGAKVTAAQARNTLEQVYRDRPDNFACAFCAASLSQAYAAMGEKDLALEAAKRAIMLYPPCKRSGVRTWLGGE